MVTSTAAYIYTLISSGVVVVSSYTSLRTKNNQAWKVVQERYTNVLKSIPTRIQSFSDECKKNIWSTAETNSYRVIMENKGISN